MFLLFNYPQFNEVITCDHKCVLSRTWRYHFTSAQKRIGFNFPPFHDCLLRVWAYSLLDSRRLNYLAEQNHVNVTARDRMSYPFLSLFIHSCASLIYPISFRTWQVTHFIIDAKLIRNVLPSNTGGWLSLNFRQLLGLVSYCKGLSICVQYLNQPVCSVIHTGCRFVKYDDFASSQQGTGQAE